MYTPLSPFQFTDADLGRLNDSVGPTERNRPDDVAKIETALDRLGYFTVDRNQGPSGVYHSELKDSLVAFQADQGLNVDAVARSNGPTVLAMADLVENNPVKNRRGARKNLGDRNKPVPKDPRLSAPSQPATIDQALDEAAKQDIERRIKNMGKNGQAVKPINRGQIRGFRVGPGRMFNPKSRRFPKDFPPIDM